ncbi:hydrolase, NUDIX family protein, partial [Cardiosporidium cionae]
MVEAMDHHTPPKDRSAEIVQGFKQLASDPQLMESALLDCYGRFITLLPDALLKDHVHLYFQIQEAFWWYEDVWREGNAYKLPKLSLKDFGLLITSDCPVLKKFVPPSQNEVFLRNWSRYCRTIPLRGAILLNGDLKKCLMVQVGLFSHPLVSLCRTVGSLVRYLCLKYYPVREVYFFFVYIFQGWRGGSWMFPRGKVDEMEEDSVCACREIWEEIGVDISPYIDEQVFIETVMEEQPIKLFVIPGIKESTLFVPKKRKEIGNIRWIEVKTLPGWTICGDAEADKTLSVTAVTSVDTLNSVSPSPIPASPSPPATLKFWQVNPFVNCLREWVQLLNKNSSKHRWCLAVEDAPSDIVAFRYQIPPNIPSLYLQHLQNADAHVLSKVDCKSQPPLLLHPIPIGGSAIDGSSLSNGMRENGKNIAMGSHGGEPRSALLPQNYVQNTNGFRLPSRRGGRVCAMRLKDVGQRSFDDHDVEHLLALRRRALGSYMNGEPALLSSLGGMMGPKQKRGSNLQGENSAAITGKVLLRGRGKKTAHASFDDLGVSYQRLHPLRGMGRGSAGKDSLNETTFGKESASGWSVEEMFKLNAEKFGVMSTYDIAHYTVPLPSSLPTKERNLPPQTLAPPTVLSSVTSTMRRGHTLGENASRGLPAASAVLPNTEDSLPSSSDAPQEIGHFLLSLLKKDKDIHRSVVAPPLPSVDSVSAPKEIPSSTKCGNPLRDSIAAEEAPVASGRSMILPGKLSPLSQPASFISYLDFQSFAHKMQHTIASLPEADTRVEDTV